MSVVVDGGVPDEVEVADTVLGWNFLVIATSVALWVGRVDFGNSVLWLMEVSDVVNDQSQGERLLVCLVTEVASNLANVIAF